MTLAACVNLLEKGTFVLMPKPALKCKTILSSMSSKPIYMVKGSMNGLIETDKRMAPFVYWFGLQNLRRHMCCRAIKTKLIGGTVIDYQCPLYNVPQKSCFITLSTGAAGFGACKKVLQSCVDMDGTMDRVQFPQSFWAIIFHVFLLFLSGKNALAYLWNSARLQSQPRCQCDQMARLVFNLAM